MNEELKEKYVENFVADYTGRCPVCLDQGTTSVLPFGNDNWFCENPNCKVTRHTNVGYHTLTEDSIQAPNVTYVKPSMILKRK